MGIIFRPMTPSIQTLTLRAATQMNRASIDNKPVEPEIVVTHLMEGIGIALDVPNDRMFVTDFVGSVYSARLDGFHKQLRPLLTLSCRSETERVFEQYRLRKISVGPERQCLHRALAGSRLVN
jgi:hypothetical protein